MIHPSLWRSFFRPAYARLCGIGAHAGKNVWFHSDGGIAAIVPDWSRLGVQVLNPQVDAVGATGSWRACAGRTCIEGDLDRQWLLPFGTPDAVRAAVRADIRRLWPGRRAGQPGTWLHRPRRGRWRRAPGEPGGTVRRAGALWQLRAGSYP